MGSVRMLVGTLLPSNPGLAVICLLTVLGRRRKHLHCGVAAVVDGPGCEAGEQIHREIKDACLGRLEVDLEALDARVVAPPVPRPEDPLVVLEGGVRKLRLLPGLLPLGAKLAGLPSAPRPLGGVMTRWVRWPTIAGFSTPGPRTAQPASTRRFLPTYAVSGRLLVVRIRGTGKAWIRMDKTRSARLCSRG